MIVQYFVHKRIPVLHIGLKGCYGSCCSYRLIVPNLMTELTLSHAASSTMFILLWPGLWHFLLDEDLEKDNIPLQPCSYQGGLSWQCGCICFGGRVCGMTIESVMIISRNFCYLATTIIDSIHCVCEAHPSRTLVPLTKSSLVIEWALYA